jgi:Tol biopolymer transport system component
MRRRLTVAAAVVLLVGCFPITVSVSPDGRMVLVRGEGVVIYDLKKDAAAVVAKPPGEMKAAWAAFSPDGKQLLWVMSRENGPGDLYVAKGDGTEAKKIFTSGSPMVYATWSPDAKHVSVGEVSNQQKEAVGKNLVNVKVVDAATGAANEVAKDTTQFHDWTADGKGIVAFFAEKKAAEEHEAIRGQLILFGLDGTKTVLAEAIAGEDNFVDVSPDGKDVLLTAARAAAPGGEALDAQDPDDQNRLYRVDVAKKLATKISDEKVNAAVFSPDGKHVLFTTAEDQARLVVCGPDGADAKVLASDVLTKVGDMSSARVIPAWLADDTVVYWKNRVVIGTVGTAVTTMSIKIDGTGAKSLQAKLDALLEKE